ncbi:hypothetical protein IGI42_002131 [Enterococcus sp. AZ109]
MSLSRALFPSSSFRSLYSVKMIVSITIYKIIEMFSGVGCVRKSIEFYVSKIRPLTMR